MKLVYLRFSGLKPEYKKAVVAQVRSEMLEKRNALIKRCGQAVADSCWWAKFDYINSWTYDNDFLFSVCADCGCPTRLMECVDDKEANYQQRLVTWKCCCGKRYQSYE